MTTQRHMCFRGANLEVLLQSMDIKGSHGSPLLVTLRKRRRLISSACTMDISYGNVDLFRLVR